MSASSSRESRRAENADWNVPVASAAAADDDDDDSFGILFVLAASRARAAASAATEGFGSSRRLSRSSFGEKKTRALAFSRDVAIVSAAENRDPPCPATQVRNRAPEASDSEDS
jgi:hypothetical protein